MFRLVEVGVSSLYFSRNILSLEQLFFSGSDDVVNEDIVVVDGFVAVVSSLISSGYFLSLGLVFMVLGLRGLRGGKGAAFALSLVLFSPPNFDVNPRLGLRMLSSLFPTPSNESESPDEGREVMEDDLEEEVKVAEVTRCDGELAIALGSIYSPEGGRGDLGFGLTGGGIFP